MLLPTSHKLNSMTLIAPIIFILATTVQATNNLGVPIAPHECTIQAIEVLQNPSESLIVGGDLEYACEDGNGLLSPLHLDEVQQKSLQSQAAKGQILFGKSKINTNEATFNRDGSVTVRSGKPLLVENRENEEKVLGRRIRPKANKKHYILFRVTDVDGLVHPHSPEVMSDNVFGTRGDQINLQSQLAACSAGQFRIVPGARPGFDISNLESARGVIDIKIDISQYGYKFDILNLALSKAQEVMGREFNFPTNTLLTKYADHVLFSIAECSEPWNAFTSSGGYWSVYQKDNYGYPRVLMHEIGHNFGLPHSTGINGGAYSDHTCAMGNPLYGDDLGQMCFNPAKIWQLQHYPHPVNMDGYGWYNPSDFITVDTSSGAQVYEMIGVGEYRLRRRKPKALVLQIIVPGGNDQYIGFNSAKGANAHNVQASDMVTIHEWHTTDVNKYGGYWPSYLKGYIAQGESFLLGNHATVTVQCINTAVTPSVACVCVREESQTCPNDCACSAPIDRQLETTTITQAGACQEDGTC